MLKKSCEIAGIGRFWCDFIKAFNTLRVKHTTIPLEVFNPNPRVAGNGTSHYTHSLPIRNSDKS